MNAQLAADVSPRVRSLWAAVTALPKGGETLYGLAASARSNSTSGFHGVSFHCQSSTFRYSFEGTHHSDTTALAAALELVLAKLGGIPASLAVKKDEAKLAVRKDEAKLRLDAQLAVKG